MQQKNNIYSFLNKYRKYILFLIDLIIVTVSYLIPFLITGVTDNKAAKLQYYLSSVKVYAVIYMLVLYMFKVYDNIWRYSGVMDILRCVIASSLANLIFLIVTKIFDIWCRYYIYIGAFIVSTFFICTIRIVYISLMILLTRDNKFRYKNKNVMIIGAGESTNIILNEIKRNNPDNYVIKCIIDDDTSKIGRSIQSVPVVSGTDKIEETVKKFNIDLIIFSIPSIDKENKKRILDICANTKCKLKIVHEVYSLISNKGSILSNIRDVQIEDLLGREPIKLDCQATHQYIQNKTVLVTGGGGSIGSELCRQIASYQPTKLIILDIYENNAYDIQQELLMKYKSNINLDVEIASVRDIDKLDKLFNNYHIDIVFHAAAHKHVPLMEHNPEEAIKNNVLGTLNVVRMADKYNVQKFVLISTDKAVNPTSVMGATKRIGEMIVQAYNQRSNTDYVAVRFGNVLGSNGSVIPLFIEQIKSGGPVTVTDKRITRYFMTIPEAVQLVLKASSMADGGEIFVLDMGQPVKINDLAFNLIRLSGLEPNVDIDIKYTGLRPGEKLYEELLITKSDEQLKTDDDKIFIEKPKSVDESELFETIELLRQAAVDVDLNREISLIQQLVLTYKLTLNKNI